MPININVTGRIGNRSKTWQANLVGGTETLTKISDRTLWALLILTHALREELPSHAIITQLQDAFSDLKSEQGEKCDSRALAFRNDLFENWERENRALLEAMRSEETVLLDLLNRGFSLILNTYYPHSTVHYVCDRWPRMRQRTHFDGDFEEKNFQIIENELLDRFASFNRNWWVQKSGATGSFEWKDNGHYRDPIACSPDSIVFREIISRRVYSETTDRHIINPFKMSGTPLSVEETAFLEGLPINIFARHPFINDTQPCLSLEEIKDMHAAAGWRLPRIEEMLYLINGLVQGKRIPSLRGAPTDIAAIPEIPMQGPYRSPSPPNTSWEMSQLSLANLKFPVLALNSANNPFSYGYDYLQKEKDRLPDVAKKIDDMNEQDKKPEGLLVAVGTAQIEMKWMQPPITETGITIRPFRGGIERVQFLPVI
ncbi:MAG: hypothetical protein HQ564_03025 [Candidatus Saganbacteria bacterium]|nr:hypothetical protein [Candidatus Saganbacteria bacterium]